MRGCNALLTWMHSPAGSDAAPALHACAHRHVAVSCTIALSLACSCSCGHSLSPLSFLLKQPVFDALPGRRWWWAGTTATRALGAGCRAWTSTRSRHALPLLCQHRSHADLVIQHCLPAAARAALGAEPGNCRAGGPVSMSTEGTLRGRVKSCAMCTRRALRR